MTFTGVLRAVDLTYLAKPPPPASLVPHPRNLFANLIISNDQMVLLLIYSALIDIFWLNNKYSFNDV